MPIPAPASTDNVATPQHQVVAEPSSRTAYVIFHAGEVYGRDSVRWYSPRSVGESERFYREYHNIGDSVVYDSTLKMLGFDVVIPVDFNNPDPWTVDLIKATCSHGILRGSNYFHPEMQWGKLVDFVRKIGLPLVVLGVGVQAPLGRTSHMGGPSEDVARALGDYCVSLGVRGERSAQMFADVGVKNVRIVGCPSMFRSLKPHWEMQQDRIARLPPLPTRDIPASITLRREIGPDYVEQIDKYLATQKRFICDAAKFTNMTLFAQGELFEKYFFHGREDLLATEILEPVEQNWIDGISDPMIAIYRKSLFYSEDVSDFCKVLFEGHFVTGFRVHGVLPALAMGIPGALVNYDQRTNELIRTFDIPSVSIDSCSFLAAYEIIRNFDYSRISRNYLSVLAEATVYFTENDIPHRLSS